MSTLNIWFVQGSKDLCARSPILRPGSKFSRFYSIGLCIFQLHATLCAGCIVFTSFSLFVFFRTSNPVPVATPVVDTTYLSQGIGPIPGVRNIYVFKNVHPVLGLCGFLWCVFSLVRIFKK